jgi:hypothetical protein
MRASRVTQPHHIQAALDAAVEVLNRLFAKENGDRMPAVRPDNYKNRGDFS